MPRVKAYLFVRQLSSFVGRAVVFLFALSAFLAFFYVLGNAQDFLDSTQLFILGLLRASLWLELAVGVWYALFLVYRNLSEHRPLVVRWVLLALSLVVCSAVLAVLQFVRQWLQS